MDDAPAAIAPAGEAPPPLDAINSFDPALLQDPHGYYRRLREEAPVYRDPVSGAVSVARYDLILEVNRQPLVFSSDFSERLRSGGADGMAPEEAAIYAQGLPPVNTMLTADPPAHTRYRKLGAKGFTMKRVEGLGPYVAQTAHALIDAFAAEGRCEFKTAFADLLPMTVIADALGVPREHMGDFKRWSDSFIAQLSGQASPERRLQAARDIVEFQRYFVERIEEKRARPTEDILSDLATADLAEEGDARKMDHAELISMIQQILVAGNETTAHALTAGLYYLIRDPALMGRLRAEPDLVPGFVEETLRYLTPVSNMWRLARQDAEIGGVPVKAGEMILLRYGSANRDEAHFPNADAFDPERENGRSHLSFGAGIHTCIGAQLARKEMATAFPVLLGRLADIRLADPDAPLRYSPNILLRGVVELPIVFRAA